MSLVQTHAFLSVGVLSQLCSGLAAALAVVVGPRAPCGDPVTALGVVVARLRRTVLPLQLGAPQVALLPMHLGTLTWAQCF